MMTYRQIEGFVARTFPKLTVQVSVHGAGRGSILVYGPGISGCDFDTEWVHGKHRITRAQLKQTIREHLTA